MANKCTKCGDTDSYNFALNIGLCNPCIGERLEELEEENESLNKRRGGECQECGSWVCPPLTCLNCLSGQDLESKLRKINCNLTKRIKKLEAHLMNINTCVAIIANDEVIRTSKELPKILANLEKYIEDALKGK